MYDPTGDYPYSPVLEDVIEQYADDVTTPEEVASCYEVYDDVTGVFDIELDEWTVGNVLEYIGVDVSYASEPDRRFSRSDVALAVWARNGGAIQQVVGESELSEQDFTVLHDAIDDVLPVERWW